MAEPVTSSASKEDFTFDYGDISIKVNLCGEGAIFGKVSSSALALASPVWKKFIFPPFPQLNGIEEIVELEGEVGAIGVTRTNFEAGTGRKDFGRVTKKQQQSWPVEELDFTDDEPDALLVLLRIAHLQFKDVPTSPSYEILLNLAILCDQYSCVALARPWFHDWFANEEVESVRNNQGSWLNIAWVFGREKAFEAVAKKMVKELYFNKYGEPYSWAVDEYIMRPFPDGLLGEFLSKEKKSTANFCFSHQTVFLESVKQQSRNSWTFHLPTLIALRRRKARFASKAQTEMNARAVML
jgi:hypothetical protein